jgi:GDPmannose 4,6-dehydratase
LVWEGEGVDTTGVDQRSGKTIIRVNPKFYRPADVDLLIGDASKARNKLGWVAEMALPQLAEMMVKADLRRVRAGQTLI